MQQSKRAERPKVLVITILLIVALSCMVLGISLYFTKDIPTVYLAVAPNTYVIPFIITTIGLCLLAITVIWIFRHFQAGLFIIAGVFSCVLLFSIYWGSMSHEDSIAFNSHVYHLALSDDAQWSDYILCECDTTGILCRCRAFYSRPFLGRPYSNTLSIDNTKNELRVSSGNDIIYTYGATQHCFATNGVCLER